MRCPNCGALNQEGAQWCNQCLTSFRRPVRIVPAPSETKETPPIDSVQGGSDSERPTGTELRSPRDKQGKWKCPVCESDNSADETRCSVCGTDLFEHFSSKSQPTSRSTGPKNPNIAMVLSVVPGAGHIFLGRVAEGAGRLVLATWWFGTALALNTVSALRWMGIVFLLAGLFLVGVSIIDAHSVGEDEGQRPILNRKVIYFMSLILFGLLFMGSMITFMTIR